MLGQGEKALRKSDSKAKGICRSLKKKNSDNARSAESKSHRVTITQSKKPIHYLDLYDA